MRILFTGAPAYNNLHTLAIDIIETPLVARHANKPPLVLLFPVVLTFGCCRG